MAGAAYGVDVQKNGGGKLLDVLFASTLSPMTFALRSIVFIARSTACSPVNAAGVATRGTIGGDGDIDFGIDWQSVIVPFGNGGSFELSLGDLDFTTQGVQTQMATIKLLSGPASTEAPGQTVPEPTSLALFALAFSTLGMRRLRRAS